MRALINKNAGGFTLIEIILYLGLFSIVMTGFLLVTYGLVQGSGQSQSAATLNEELIFLLGKIEHELAGAKSDEVFVPSADQLQIGVPPDQIIFGLDGANLVKDTSPLNSASVEVTGLNFTKIPASGGKPGGVRVEITLSAFSSTLSGDSTAYLRF